MQLPENQKNLFLAIILSVAVMFAWQMLYAGPKQQKLRQQQQAEQQARKAAEAAKPQVPGAPAAAQPSGIPGAPPAPGLTVGPSKPSALPATGLPSLAQPKATREAALSQEPRIPVETPSLTGSISLKGGRIDDLILVKHKQTTKPDSPNVVLFSPPGAPKAYYAEFRWVPSPTQQVKVPGPETTWTAASRAPLAPGRPVKLTYDNGAGLIFERQISVDENYMFTVTDAVQNNTGTQVLLHPYRQIFRYGTPKIEGFFIQHEGLIGVFDEEKLQELDYSEAAENEEIVASEKKAGWLGITDKYWAAALIPDQQQTLNVRLGRVKNATTTDQFQAEYVRVTPVAVPANGRTSTTSRLFAGAKEFEAVEGYATNLKIANFDKLIDWGWFSVITKPLYYLINWLYKFLGNFGLAILAVTVIVKLLFFPLANKSYESMSRMKKLQPQMEQLKERYGDDKARMQQAMMEMYKKEKINPAAGCLPILVQIPVFFALYKVLFITLDMRHAPFFGWIRDLSGPDPTSLFNLFGLLPYDVPSFLVVGIWPLIMGITMWVQMQLNPQQPDPTQQMIFNWMPVMFTFLLASFPAGLVIYWAWNNLLSILQQSVIMKKQGVEIPLLKNIGLDKLLGKVAGSGGGGKTKT